ncbi:F-box/kelch-repeat protein At3g23880-like [Bidens hawaiensis]|uniref:F-box/kelch-repeat protein At3g23880-like n=1 Tax=Bidens hawaiensis TaxID=980011 RepID=UPI00404A6015
MSDNIPFEIQVEIIKRLPARSLIRSRSVSKTWKSLIDSSEYDNQDDYEPIYLSIVEDHTFPLNRVSLTPHPCFLADPHEYYYIIGLCHGLLCFYAAAKDRGTGWAVLWNPSIRRAFEIDVPNVTNGNKVYDTALGFGVCLVTKDPKIVKITFVHPFNNLESETVTDVPFQVEVFTLSTGAWRSLSSNLPTKSVSFHHRDHISYSVVIDGIIYWLASDEIAVGGGYYDLIISFDITREEFGEINLPYRLARSGYFLTISKLKESLVVVEGVIEPNRVVYNLWMMEGGLSKTFTKLYTFNVNTPNQALMGFRSGEPIIQLIEDDRGELVVYNPQSNQKNNLGFNGVFHTFSVHPYIETLYLLDRPDSVLTEVVQDNLAS